MYFERGTKSVEHGKRFDEKILIAFAAATALLAGPATQAFPFFGPHRWYEKRKKCTESIALCASATEWNFASPLNQKPPLNSGNFLRFCLAAPQECLV